MTTFGPHTLSFSFSSERWEGGRERGRKRKGRAICSHKKVWFGAFAHGTVLNDAFTHGAVLNDAFTHGKVLNDAFTHGTVLNDADAYYSCSTDQE